MSKELNAVAVKVGEALLARGWMVATAESCTGGWVAKALTDIAGSSAYVDRGFVTYTNEAKREMLGVLDDALAAFGAVSETVVREMAAGALRNSHAQVALAISGIAGPGGGTAEKPVGTVCFAWAIEGEETTAERCRFEGDREAVRRQAAVHALERLLERL